MSSSVVTNPELPAPPEASDDAAPIPKDLNQVAEQLGELFTPPMDGVASAAAKNRTQIRLLGLYASVIRYKWENGRLPQKLEDAVGAARVADPVGENPFTYTPAGPWSFTIVSRGWPAVGQIGLKYRRQPGTIVTPNDPGPPVMAGR